MLEERVDMSFLMIDKNNIPVIKKKNVSVKSIEKIFIKIPYGMVIVVDDEKKLLGYYDVNNWDYGNDLEAALQNIPLWKSTKEIDSEYLGKYPLYPIVDEDNKLIKIYYETESGLSNSNNQLATLMDIKRMDYNFNHFIDKTGCNDKKIAIFTDYQRINASLQLGETLCNNCENIKFEGVFIYSGYEALVKNNTYNMNSQLMFIDSLSELADRGIDIVFFNSESYERATRINYLRKENIKCKSVTRALKLMNNACLTDYALIKYKKELQDKGIKLYSMAVPRSADIGCSNSKNSSLELLEFLKNNMNETVAQELFDIRKIFIKNMVKDGEMRYYKDIKSSVFNVISKCRFVPKQPSEYTKTVYLVGPCIVAGLYVCDDDTLGAHLQKYYNTNGEKVRIVALPISTEAHREYYLKTVMSLRPQEGDVIVLVDQTFRFLRYDIDCIEECENAVKKYGRQIYLDIPSHCNSLLMDIIAKKLYDSLKKVNLNKEECENEYSEYVVKNSTEKKEIDSLSNNSELIEYKEYIKSNSFIKKVVNGGIVMNCNPFTKGHLYLIEYAASQVDYLYIFAVQEDKSFFKFDDRIELMRQGTAHISNVRVFPSGKFILSSTTFSEYFDKANLSGTTVDTSMDVEIFAKHIAPVLDITVRFVGQEPLDPITNQYNDAMKRILPEYGIELREIPRKESDGQVISASRVRKYLQENRWDEIKESVPITTYNFLYEKYYKK